MRRRGFLGSVTASALIASMPVFAKALSAPYVISDYGRLRRVLMHSPTLEDQAVYLATEEPLNPTWLSLPSDAVEQHEALVRLVQASGAEILQVKAVLASAIREAKRRGLWSTWLYAAFPQFGGAVDTVTAETLLARDPHYKFQKDDEGNYRHVQDGMLSMWYTRDFGIMTPSGLIISNLVTSHRRRETTLFRFMVQFSPELRDYPIVFDAVQEGLHIEGGDVQVLDEHTLLVGVGNRTDPGIARILARRLNMDVIAVQMRKTDFVKPMKEPDALRLIFLHLDTCMTLLGPRNALAFPWLFEAKYSKDNPLLGLVRGGVISENFSSEDAEKWIGYFTDMGRIRHFSAGSGAEDVSMRELKLVDFLRQRGFNVVNVGGVPPEVTDYRHLIDVVLHEHERQAANVVATAPNDVIGYEGPALTHKALAHAGIKVSTFNGRELWRGDGGPHCLTLPLERI